MIGIIDYDAGNLKSVEKALLHLGQETVVSRDQGNSLHADKRSSFRAWVLLELPWKTLKYGLVELIHEIVENNTPFLGICLGLQLLFGEKVRA